MHVRFCCVSATQDSSSGDRSKFWDLVAVAFIKGKVVLTGAGFKQITAQVVDYDTATWLKPYTGTMLACIMWDAMMCHAIMQKSVRRPSWTASAAARRSFLSA